MQNDLEEFFAMVDFTNPGALGDEKNFRKVYQTPILRGREPDASEAEREKGNAAQAALSSLVNCFLLRRTNELLSKHLPPKIVQNVCCRATPLQVELYQAICGGKDVTRMCKGGKVSKQILSSITSLKKLCNHPKIVFDSIRSTQASAEGQMASIPPQKRRPSPLTCAAGAGAALAELASLFPPEFYNRGANQETFSHLSGKMALLERMLFILYHEKKPPAPPIP